MLAGAPEAIKPTLDCCAWAQTVHFGLLKGPASRTGSGWGSGLSSIAWTYLGADPGAHCGAEAQPQPLTARSNKGRKTWAALVLKDAADPSDLPFLR